ncbi:MAG: glycosyl transferase family 1, partial [Castellaniella sp.]
MRVLLVVTGLQLGGAERQVVDLADRLAARGHAVAIAYLTGDAAVRPALRSSCIRWGSARRR